MPPSPQRRSQSAKDREVRRLRIMASVQAGHTYQTIGREEGLTRERIRQIVSESVRVNSDERVDLPRVQMARLEPALRLAAGAVAKGRLTAISPLLKILTQIDKYGAAFSPSAPDDENIRERLLLRLDRAAAAIQRANRSDEVPSENLELRDFPLEAPTTP